jgi:hypothetical protein
MKEFWGGKRMAADEGVKERVLDWLNGLAADFCDKETVKLLQRLDKA